MRRPAMALLALLAILLAALCAQVLPPVAAQASTPPVTLGAYADGFAGTGTQLTQFESLLGNKVAIASSFRGWGDLFPDSVQQLDADTGHTLLVAWDMGATAATRFTTFTSHAHDAYLAQEAATARAFGSPLYIRPWAEMNGDWTAFQPTASGSRPAGGTPAQFIAAWRYLVSFFRSHGALNVRWVFNPTTDTYAQTTPVASIWPGSSYVDVLGLDGYNWGTGGVFAWKSFQTIYATQYGRLHSLAPTKPVWVCEVGAKEPAENDGAPVDPSHSKASWYTGMLAYLATTKITTVVLFDTRKERDWRIESDSSTLGVVRNLARTASPAIR